MIESDVPMNVLVMNVSCLDGMASGMRVRNLIVPLIESGKIRVLNLINQKDTRLNLQKNGELNHIKYRVISFNLKNIISIFKFFKDGIQFIKNNKTQGKNIIFYYDTPDIKNIIFLIFGKIYGYKLIFDIIEDNRYYTKFNGYLHRFKNNTSLLLLHMVPYFGNAFIGISHHLYNRLCQIAKGKIPVYLVPISVNLEYFGSPKYLHVKNNIKIFYGGSFAEKDGISYLINSFDIISQEFSNVNLILTGRGNDDDIKNHLDQISQLKYRHRVIFKGFLETEQYYDTLNDCDIFCMVRIDSKFSNAGFPFKIGEFLASGKAVIVTDIGDISKYLTNNKNALIIKPNSLEQLVDAIKLLLNNPKLIETLGLEARKVAEKNFDALIISNRLLEIFNKI